MTEVLCSGKSLFIGLDCTVYFMQKHVNVLIGFMKIVTVTLIIVDHLNLEAGRCFSSDAKS